MYFTEGLRAFHRYKSSLSPHELEESIGAFKAGVEACPGDELQHFYLALIRLEQASVPETPAEAKSAGGEAAGSVVGSEPSAYADSGAMVAREGLITDALLEFEQYQRLKRTESLQDEWLYLWSEYNRAAAQVHRLNPKGYLRARGIIVKYLESDGYAGARSLPCIADDRAPRSYGAGELVLAPQVFEETTLMYRARSWWRKRDGPDPDRARRLAMWLKEAGNEREYYALLFQMESLLNLTRSRPMREPEVLRNTGQPEVADVGLEGPDAVEQLLNNFLGRLEKAREDGVLSGEAVRDMTSDYWNQKGHLECARGLAAAGFTGEQIRQIWSDLGTPLNNQAAFRILAKKAPGIMKPYVEQAAVCFRTALTYQPRWRPAVANRDEMDGLRSVLRS